MDLPVAVLFQPPPIASHHLRLTGEPALDAIIKKQNHTVVEAALQLAQPHLEGRGLCLPISWSWGQLSTIPGDSRLGPDWAGTIHSGRTPYPSRVPGETKQSQKWNTAMRNSTPAEQTEFRRPLQQLLGYCIPLGTRYGYIITDYEAVFLRRTKSEYLPVSRSPRQSRQPLPKPHQRVTSIASITSQTSEISLETAGSRYTDGGNPDINEEPLEMAVVPWSNSGAGQITINLAIWFIHLLASSDISVEERYPALGAWQKDTDDHGQLVYRQVGSRRVLNLLPYGATVD